MNAAIPFPPIYVVSLPRSHERRRSIRRRLDSLGRGYEIVDAVDGETVDWSQHTPRLRRLGCRISLGRDMVAGEIGCYLSHYALWERMVAEQTECALILEDDASWDGDFAAIVMQVMTVPWHWEVVALSENAPPPLDRVLCPLGDGGRRLVRYKGRASTTAAYLVRLPGAEKLCLYCRDITNALDGPWECWWKNGVAFYRVSPPPAKQISTDAVIRGRTTIRIPFYGKVSRRMVALGHQFLAFWYACTHPPRKSRHPGKR